MDLNEGEFRLFLRSVFTNLAQLLYILDQSFSRFNVYFLFLLLGVVPFWFDLIRNNGDYISKVVIDVFFMLGW